MSAAPTVPAAVRRRRWLRLAAVLAGAAVGAPRAPLTGARGRRRLLVCAAARVLTAAGVRVEVRACPTGWPRTGGGAGHLVVANSVCWVDELALLTAVPGLPVRTPTVDRVAELLRDGQTVTVRPEGRTPAGAGLGQFRPTLLQAAVDAGAPVCPVAVRYRTDVGDAVAAQLAGHPLARSLTRVVATRGLVVELHLLPALDPAGADRRELAALAEYAVAAVTEAGRPAPRRPRSPAGAVGVAAARG
jgi:1-acyl-sn-glycerol-3-phosphate acyltransferase